MFEQIAAVLDPADPRCGGLLFAGMVCGDIRRDDRWPLNPSAERRLVERIVERSVGIINKFAIDILEDVGFGNDEIREFRAAAVGGVVDILTQRTLH